MAEVKKARTKETRASSKRVQKAAPTLAADVMAEEPVTAELPLQPVAPAIVETPKLQPLPGPRPDALRLVMSEAVNATARGALEVHDKIIDALQAQSNAAFEVWKTSLEAPHLSEAIRVQTNGARRAYETASAQWSDIAATTANWFHKSLEPFHAALHRRDR
ncbi:MULTISPECIES: phasin family protein [Microvirga]|uniref:phasin family protein n=1 Tax=Microvirga TaxID=186650 RepID=UPI001CFF64ED|nr:phasin family protein [Microvirga lenta]MCB5175501.1 phasin family protein [Microvirga lenta]